MIMKLDETVSSLLKRTGNINGRDSDELRILRDAFQIVNSNQQNPIIATGTWVEH
jgi:hypothetical protein